MSPSSLFLLIGLGNPGREYEYTRHNFGFYLLDTLVAHKSASWVLDGKCRGLASSVMFGQRKLLCLKPQTFMNNSGISVQAFCHFYKTEPSSVMVVCDDISMPFGSFKISTIPGTAGHNGVKSVAAHIGGDFLRYRMGIGTKPPFMKLDDYVLSRFSEDERKRLPEIAAVFERNIERIVDNGVQKALNSIEYCV